MNRRISLRAAYPAAVRAAPGDPRLDSALARRRVMEVLRLRGALDLVPRALRGAPDAIDVDPATLGIREARRAQDNASTALLDLADLAARQGRAMPAALLERLPRVEAVWWWGRAASAWADARTVHVHGSTRGTVLAATVHFEHFLVLPTWRALLPEGAGDERPPSW